ncbi:hypothetical protein TNCV_3972641 [Trichonephila clavipes]|nr:hypothetical protein TNCV_3972641 [Trichonephila clavipes]
MATKLTLNQYNATGTSILRITVTKRLNAGGSGVTENIRASLQTQVLGPKPECVLSVSQALDPLEMWRLRGSQKLAPTTIDELKSALMQEGVRMPQELIKILVYEMKQRLETCIAVRSYRAPY